MTRKEAVDLYSILREVFVGDMDKEIRTEFRMMRLRLKAVFDEYEIFRKEISDETKPKDYKEGDDTTAWVAEFKPLMEKWQNEETSSLLDTNLLSKEQYFALMDSNKLVGIAEDILYDKLVKL